MKSAEFVRQGGFNEKQESPGGCDSTWFRLLHFSFRASIEADSVDGIRQFHVVAVEIP
jgi:hypothetical protein